MQKIIKLIKTNKAFSIGVFLLGIIFTLGGIQAYEKTIESKTDDQETSYGAMGYGRGTGSGNNAKQDSDKNKQNNKDEINKDNCLMDGCLLVEDADYPVGELDQQTIEFLKLGLADERKALATYEATIEKFGSVRPFINIARAEEQHMAMLKALFDKYGVKIPADTTQVGELPETLGEVCGIAVQAEIDNDLLYQNMINDVEQQDIRDVFEALAAASRDMHLPAFEKCAN